MITHVGRKALIVKLNWRLQCKSSRLLDYSDAKLSNYNIAKHGNDNRNKKVTFKNCAPFTDSTSKTNNKGVDHAKDIDVIIPIFNLIEYSDNYFKISGSLCQYSRDKAALNDIGGVIDFPNDTDSANDTARLLQQLK